jgi:hypothetical protein
VDGDDTYDASSAPQLVEMLITQTFDMVNAALVNFFVSRQFVFNQQFEPR